MKKVPAVLIASPVRSHSSEDQQANPREPAAPGPERRKARRVEYKVKLSSAEHAQLISLRDTCREAGHSVNKGMLLRAAIAILNQQSSLKIEEQLLQLSSLKGERTRK